MRIFATILRKKMILIVNYHTKRNQIKALPNCPMFLILTLIHTLTITRKGIAEVKCNLRILLSKL